MTVAATDEVLALLHPDPIETTMGRPLGDHPAAPPLPRAERSARAAFERAVSRALHDPPCAVTFSGGRDSSAVLAVAAHVARREGLPLPIPVSLAFPGMGSADETSWQELVVRHLGLPDWERIQPGDDFNLLGPIAQGILMRHGLLWPSNLFFTVPVMERVPGGTVMTGVDGDGLFGGWRWASANVRWCGGRVVGREYVGRRLIAALPAPARYRVVARRSWVPRWADAAGAAAVRRRQATSWVLDPPRFDHWVHRWWCRRLVSALRVGVPLIGRQHEVDVHQPLLDPVFVSALAAEGGRRGWHDRSAVMRHLFGDLLPEPLLTRSTKAVFDNLWEGDAREFATRWTGDGLDDLPVDLNALREEWHKPFPHFGSSLLLQLAWLREAST